jgi:hypothetical protein
MIPQIFKSIKVYLVILTLIITGSLSTESFALERVITEKTFLSTNLHADRGKGALRSVNYQVMGTLIKWGTPVKIIMVDDRECKLIDLYKNIPHRFYFHRKTLKHQTPVQYFHSITTEDFNALKTKIDQLSQVDKAGIDKGIVMEGMSKEGVLIALGLPPIFVNPSPDKSTIWHYWFNKRTTFKVIFDNDGKVSDISGYYPYKQAYVPSTIDIKEKLEILRQLYEEELITKEDYERKKAETLSEH